MADVFKELCYFMKVQHSPTAAYRPQGNAENERSHQDLHNYLTMYLDDSSNSNAWHTLLHYAAWCHNSAIHSVLGRSPIEVLTGVPPRDFPSFLPNGPSDREEEQLDEFLDKRIEQLHTLREQTRLAISRAQARNMEIANKHARYHKYAIGDLVLIKHRATGYVQRKWGNKFKGPYIVQQIVSPQILLLTLPDDPTYTDYVHVSYIKPYYSVEDNQDDLSDHEPLSRSTVPFPSPMTTDLPDPANDGSNPVLPSSISVDPNAQLPPSSRLTLSNNIGTPSGPQHRSRTPLTSQLLSSTPVPPGTPITSTSGAQYDSSRRRFWDDQHPAEIQSEPPKRQRPVIPMRPPFSADARLSSAPLRRNLFGSPTSFSRTLDPSFHSPHSRFTVASSSPSASFTSPQASISSQQRSVARSTPDSIPTSQQSPITPPMPGPARRISFGAKTFSSSPTRTIDYRSPHLSPSRRSYSADTEQSVDLHDLTRMPVATTRFRVVTDSVQEVRKKPRPSRPMATHGSWQTSPPDTASSPISIAPPSPPSAPSSRISTPAARLTLNPDDDLDLPRADLLPRGPSSRSAAQRAWNQLQSTKRFWAGRFKQDKYK